MSAGEKEAQMELGVGREGAYVSLGTAEDPKGSGVPGQILAQKTEVSWVGVWSPAQAWWTEVSLTGREPAAQEVTGKDEPGSPTPAPATSSPFAFHIVVGHDSHWQKRDQAFAK